MGERGKRRIAKWVEADAYLLEVFGIKVVLGTDLEDGEIEAEGWEKKRVRRCRHTA